MFISVYISLHLILYCFTLFYFYYSVYLRLMGWCLIDPKGTEFWPITFTSIHSFIQKRTLSLWCVTWNVKQYSSATNVRKLICLIIRYLSKLDKYLLLCSWFHFLSFFIIFIIHAGIVWICVSNLFSPPPHLPYQIVPDFLQRATVRNIGRVCDPYAQ